MAKKAGLFLGIIFVIIAILGFLGTGIVGHEGMFHTDMMHNIIHLVVGLIFVFVALKATDSIGIVFKVFGVIYLLLGIAGFFVADGESIFGLMEVNGADNILHIVLGLVIFFVGMRAVKGSSMPSSGMGGMSSGMGGMQ